VLGRTLAEAGQEQHRAIGDRSLGLQFVDEFLELAAGGRSLFDGRQSVEDEKARRPRLNFAAQQVQHCREPFPLENTKGADVIEPVRNDRFFEKAELPDMQQHPRMILGQQRHIERTAALGDMMEADLVAEDGLPRTGRALDDENAAAQKAAAQNRIQSRDPGRYALKHWRARLVSLHLADHMAKKGAI
jgi:hypothetical protein